MDLFLEFAYYFNKTLYLRPRLGGLAHLARVLAWQARGGRFESDILHIDYQGLTAM